ncbi:replication associated protein [Lynx canadensis faeces associated genomovirus CL1 148]|uniref:Replication-associated protein n=1 Tax=Lynx canadensis faeces associated genomovirus CL1 148 TaxID=2219123 RepID=A0A2Z5CJ94_9VIRU|nr:replication associated protein [Lynx canadensis faeces associated genomovirus CL1 148]AXB22610.1 replication associated protein [Lynx canadensis faeces associated genomovirus CL1 148]
MSFHCNAQYFLVTYAQCGDLDPWSVMERFSTLGAECIIARELHADLGLHLHCFVDFGRKFRSRKTDIFDVGSSHPNIEPSRGTPWAGYDYAIKDGDVVCGGLARPRQPRSKSTRNDVHQYTEITNADDIEHFWELLHHLDPKTAVVNFVSATKYAEARFADVEPGYEPRRRQDFVAGDDDGRDAVKSLVLFGEPLTGKTDWARCLGNHVYTMGIVSGDQMLKIANPDVKYAVFDDIRGGIKFFPSFKEWLGCQAYVTVTKKYKEPKLMKWGRPSIWLSNKDPRTEMDPSDANWLEANCTFIEINTPIFHANT